MKDTFRLLGALALKGLQHVSYFLSEAIGLSSEQRIEVMPFATWGIEQDFLIPRDENVLYYEDKDKYVWWTVVHKAYTWGQWYIVLDFAPDGGGVTRLLRNANRVEGLRAEELRDRAKKQLSMD